MGARASVTGDRNVAVGGDIVDSIVVTGDNVTINVGAGGAGGTLLNPPGAGRTVRKRRRPTPLDVRPAPFGDRIDRESEVTSLATSGATRLSLVGEALVGKTYVARAALVEMVAHAPRDGIVCVRGRGLALGDLLQAVWEEFYETTPASVPSARKLREDMAGRQSLVVVENAELDHDDAQALADALPGCRVFLISRERRLWDGDELVVAGLPLEASLALLERDLRRSLTETERTAATTICLAVGRHPQRLRQAAGIVARGAQTLEQLARALSDGARLDEAAVAAASERERDVLAALEPFGDAPVAAAHVEALAGPGGAQVAETLVGLGLAVAHSPRYSLAVDLTGTLAASRLERTRSEAVARFARLAEQSPQLSQDDTRAALALLRRAAQLGRSQDVVRLGRALAPALVLGRRFAAWGQASDLVQHAALETKDASAGAWALHEKGTRAACQEDPGAHALLTHALQLREELGDEPGIAATRHNLRLFTGPPWYLRRFLHVPVVAWIALVAIVAVGGAAVIASQGGSAAKQHTLQIALSGSGSVTAGTTDPCKQACERTFDDKEQVDLIATPASGWTFTHWSGDCSGSDCSLELDEDRSVTADFKRGTATGGHELTVAEADGGEITSHPAGIDCPGTCSHTFSESSVTLVAAPSSGFRLTDWGQAGCDPARECAVDLSGSAVTVRPVFTRLVTLTVTAADGGSVSFADPSGVTLVCPKDCTAQFPEGADVKLTGTPSSGFAGPDWQRSDCATGPNCTVQVNEDTTVVPTFQRAVVLTVSLSGKGTGTITADGSPLDCSGTQCTASVPVGSSLQLVATPASGSEFQTWRGGGCTTSPNCTLSVSGDTTLTAIFMPEPTLSVSVSGASGGTVVSDPAGINCSTAGGTCTASFPHGTTVTLTADPPAGGSLSTWGGGCSGTGSCSVPMPDFGGTYSVSAAFSSSSP